MSARLDEAEFQKLAARPELLHIMYCTSLLEASVGGWSQTPSCCSKLSGQMCRFQSRSLLPQTAQRVETCGSRPAFAASCLPRSGGTSEETLAGKERNPSAEARLRAGGAEGARNLNFHKPVQSLFPPLPASLRTRLG